MKIQYYLLIGLVLFLMFSCQKSEVFNPKKKIQFVEKQNDSEIVLTDEFVYNDKKQLQSILHLLDKDTISFIFNKDKTISTIFLSKENERVELTYNKSLLTNIKCFENNELKLEILVERKEKTNKIRKLSFYLAKSDSKLTSVFVPKTFQKLKVHKSNKELTAYQYITYEKDNITTVRTYLAQGKDSTLYYTATYKYDDKVNPFYGLPYPIVDLLGYSKNNISSIHYYYDNGYDEYDRALITQKFDYKYNKSYPIKCTMTEMSTFSDKTGYQKDNDVYNYQVRYSGVTASETEYYTYLK